MTREEAMEIIKKENLRRYNWFNEHLLRESEVVISTDGDGWVVYVTDEKASIVSGSIKRFSTESDALENFIKRLRTEKVLFG